MAMSVVYSNAFGGVLYENRNGVVSKYVRDTQGSTIGLTNSVGTLTDRWVYWPFGEVASRTGTNPTPLTFLGVLGYFQDVLSKLYYVRARHLRVDLARWLTTDPLWPSQPAFLYASNAPCRTADPSGLEPPVSAGSGSQSIPMAFFSALLWDYDLTVTWAWYYSACLVPCALKAGSLAPQGWVKLFVKIPAGVIVDALIAGLGDVLLPGLVCGAMFLTLNPVVALVASVACALALFLIERISNHSVESLCRRSDGTRCFYAKLNLQCCAPVPDGDAGCC